MTIKLEDYERILGIYIEATDLLKGLKFSSRIKGQLFIGLTYKLAQHAWTANYLAKKTVVKVGFDGNFYDSSSTLVIARAAIETYATLYTNLFMNEVPDERKFRLLYYEWRGLKGRQRFSATHPAIIAKKTDEASKMVEIEGKIRSTAKFRSLKPHRQVNLFKNNDFFSISESIEASGFGEATRLEMYSLLSDYAHGGYISSLQIGQSEYDTRKEHLYLGLLWIAVVLSMTIRMLAPFYAEIRDYLNIHPKRRRSIFFYSDLARAHDTQEMCALLSSNAKPKSYRVISWSFDPNGAVNTMKDTIFPRYDLARTEFMSIQLREGAYEIYFSKDELFSQEFIWPRFAP